MLEEYIAVRDGGRIFKHKPNHQYKLLSTCNTKKVVFEIKNNFRLLDGDFISKDFKHICRIDINRQTFQEEFVMYEIASKKKINSISLPELNFTTEDNNLIPYNKYKYGFSCNTDINLYFIIKGNTLIIINIDSFEKTILHLPFNVSVNLINEEIRVSKTRPLIYCESDEGFVHAINYQTKNITRLEKTSIDIDFGFIVSPDDKWLLHFESNGNGRDVLWIDEIKF